MTHVNNTDTHYKSKTLSHTTDNNLPMQYKIYNNQVKNKNKKQYNTAAKHIEDTIGILSSQFMIQNDDHYYY